MPKEAEDPGKVPPPPENVRLLMESGEWEDMSPLQRRMSYEAGASAEADPGWVARSDEAQRRMISYLNSKEHKDAMAERDASKRALSKEMHAIWVQGIRDKKRIWGEEFDPKVHLPLLDLSQTEVRRLLDEL